MLITKVCQAPTLKNLKDIFRRKAYRSYIDMSQKTDLILIHPPSLFDFRERNILYGPISDVIPSTPVFEMYPVGFMILSEYLTRHGFTVRIVNLALKMLKIPGLEVEKFLSSLDARVFGIDLHWMPHIQGSFDTAKLLKKLHPHVPVLFGGLSSSFYHKKLIYYPFIDMVVRGGSTEEPVRLLMEAIKKEESLKDVPNLTWMDKKGNVVENAFTYIPKNLDHIKPDYKHIASSVIKYRDLTGYIPYYNWVSYPMLGILTSRGCINNCLICGGSSFAAQKNCKRSGSILRSNRQIIEDFKNTQCIVKMPVFVFGDLSQRDEDSTLELFSELKGLNIKNQVVLEFFKPPGKKFLKKAIEAFPNLSFEISPETHDEKLRRKGGKLFSNQELEELIEYVLNNSNGRIDVFFMIGLSGQTKESVQETINYCEHLMKKNNTGGRLFPYIAPLSPFLDPASIAFENPERYGYKPLFKGLDDYYTAMKNAPSWEYMQSYETEWLTRQDIINLTYEAAGALNELKYKYGLLSKKTCTYIKKRIDREKSLLKIIQKRTNEHNGDFSMVKTDDLALDWKEMLMIKSTCASDELERPLWISQFIPFPRFLRNLLYKLWYGAALLINKQHILSSKK
jgi:B12-binding domain/radical SAM domain protein